MKLAPLWRQMQQSPETFTPVIVHTGQHYGRQMSEIFFEELGLLKPDICLGVGSGSHACQTAKIMERFEKVMFEQNPDWVVVFGDVNSTAAVSLVAAKERVKVAHVEAGLRSGDRTMPEELNRIVTDHLSDLLFTSCRDADVNLAQENIEHNKVHFVGNIMIDSLRNSLPKADQSPILEQLSLDTKNFALATLHRPANVDEPGCLDDLVDIILTVSLRLPVVFPAHPRTLRNLNAAGLLEQLVENPRRVRVTEPLGYLDFLKLEKDARVVLTDSGGVQEETTALMVPCLTLRANTERPVTITDGSNRLVGTSKRAILDNLDDVLSQGSVLRRQPELWDGNTASRICRVFQEIEQPVAEAIPLLEPVLN